MSKETTSDNTTSGAIVVLTDDDIITICNALGQYIPDRNEQNALLSKLCNGRRISGNVFSWTPSLDQSGAYNVTFTVSDGNGGSD